MATTSDTPSSAPPLASKVGARAHGIVGQLSSLGHQPSVRRALPAVVIILLTLVIIVFWRLAAEPEWRPMFPGLAEIEKTPVIEALTVSGIETRINTDTSEVEVIASDYHKARMALAEAGLPRSLPDGGDELDKMSMGTSRSVEAARLRHAQEIDLALSIMELADVMAARVHLALPEKSAFLRESAPPRASVFLQLEKGRVIAQPQVEAIVNLVSSSVPNMARSDVTVVDQSGRLLSRGSDDLGAQITNRQMQQKLEVEKLYRQRIESILTPLAGPGNLSVQVMVDMDFTRSEIRSERVDPETTALRSEQSQFQQTSDGIAKGIPGALSNRPPSEAGLSGEGPGQEGQDGTIQNRSEGTTRNYEVSRTVETTVPSSARVQRINAAVVVHETLTPAAEEGQPPISSAPPELIADMETLVQATIGFDAERGDRITVLARPFLEEIVPPPSTFGNMPWLPGLLRQGGVILTLAIIAFGIVRPILLRVLFPGEGNTAAAELQKEIEVQDGESLEEVRARVKERQKALTQNMLNAAKSHEEQIISIRKLVDEDAGRIATTFQNMIVEELDTVS